MPELPEVETVRRGLAAVLEGRRLVRIEQRRADLRIPFPEGFAARLEGRTVRRVDRRAKYILARLDDGNVWLIHLGISGRMVIVKQAAARDSGVAPPGPHDHVIVETDEGVVIHFHDARRFGLMTLCAQTELAAHPLFRRLGPEPLGDGFDGKALALALEGKKTPIKSALLDQRVVAGLGNIYACESLFYAGISPRRQARTVKGARAERLARAIRRVLGAAIAAGGSSLRDHVRPSGELGYFQHRFAVYGREGEPCPGCDCDAARTGGIKRITQGGRSSFYCGKRQR